VKNSLRLQSDLTRRISFNIQKHFTRGLTPFYKEHANVEVVGVLNYIW